jgi:hypothetical protein
MATALQDVVSKAREQLHDLTSLKVGSTVSVRKGKSGWVVQVEVVEKNSIPDSQDILAMYDLAVDGEGNVEDFARAGMRRRAEVALTAVAEPGA